MSDRSAPQPQSEVPKNTGRVPKTPDKGFAQDLANQVKLTLKLLGDRRVNFLLRGMTAAGGIFTLVYFLGPDPLPGPLDDLGITGIYFLLTYVFVELCPKWVVTELRRKLEEEDGEPPEDEKSVVESQFREEQDKNTHVRAKADNTHDVAWLKDYAVAAGKIEADAAKKSPAESTFSKSLLYGLAGGTVATAVAVTSWLLTGASLLTMEVLGVITESQLTNGLWYQVTRFIVYLPEISWLILAAVWVCLVLLATGVTFVWVSARPKRIRDKPN